MPRQAKPREHGEGSGSRGSQDGEPPWVKHAPEKAKARLTQKRQPPPPSWRGVVKEPSSSSSDSESSSSSSSSSSRAGAPAQADSRSRNGVGSASSSSGLAASSSKDQPPVGPPSRASAQKRLAELEEELRKRKLQLQEPEELWSDPDTSEEERRYKASFLVKSYNEGEESEEERRSSDGFMNTEEEAEASARDLERFLDAQVARARARRAAANAERERERKAQEQAFTEGGLRQRKRHADAKSKDKDNGMERERKGKDKKASKVPKGYVEVSEEEYYQRMKEMERNAAFLGFGPVGFFCFIYVIMMGVVFGLLYLGTYLRDPKFFDPFYHNGFGLLMR